MTRRPQTASSTLRKCVKSNYGNWLLVHLPSGRWACLWEQVLGVEDMCSSVLNGTWFHEKNPDAPTRAEALQLVVKGIEGEIRRHAVHPIDIRDNFQPILQRARAALARHSKQKA